MEKLADIAKRRLAQHRLGGDSQASAILFTAEQFLRHHFTEDPRCARPLKLQQGVLWLGVNNASVAQEVRGISQRLIQELKFQYDKIVIRQVRTKDLTSF